MSIFNHFKHLNLSQGQEDALTKLEAFLASPVQVFMLKGYAGSGKTTLLKGLFGYLNETKRDFAVMASTGRAAKVLRNITGYGMTIHRTIYNVQNIVPISPEADDEASQSFQYHFPIIEHQGNNRVLIIDEASMISNRESKGELFIFGTGVVLQDILTYARIKSTSNKIIFVGDPTQLPPVGDNESSALKKTFFDEANLNSDEVEMKQVFRQESEEGRNLILENASRLRELIFSSRKSELSFDFDDKTSIKLKPEHVATKFLELFPNPDLNNGVIISYSNALAHSYNIAIRDKLFPGIKSVTSGDLLMINSNNYKYVTELFNGDIARVLFASELTETITAPVFVTDGDKRVKKNISLSLREVILEIKGCDDPVKCKIFDCLLNSGKRDLTTDEIKALYVNFVIRFKEKQKINREKGLPFFKVGSEEFKNDLKTDGLTNAVRVKYGYAITGHKSQGGEWPVTFVDYSGQAVLSEHPLRWCYTAATRAKKVAYAINPPEFGTLSKLVFSKPIKSSSFPAEALSFTNIIISPFHKAGDHPSKSMKYWELDEKFDNSPFTLRQVTSHGDYLERYVIGYEDEELIIQANHNKGGFFEPFRMVKGSAKIAELLELVNRPYQQNYNFIYAPSEPFLDRLYSRIQDVCFECNIIITNIKEHKENYFIGYYFITSGQCSFIKFYFNSKGQFTSAIPTSDLGEQDEKLNLLLIRLAENV